MADYDSDSSVDSSGDIRTQVLLGYASATPTSDDFSQIGGHPTWLDPARLPSAHLAKCKVCGKLMSLMLQLNSDLPEQFASHERRLYVWVCRGKACRGKEGSVRGFRGVRGSNVGGAVFEERVVEEPSVEEKKEEEQPKRVGEALFGVKSTGTAAGGNPFGGNPFASGGTGSTNANPFAGTSSLAAKPAQKPTQDEGGEKTSSLPETFAQKVRISTPSTTNNPPTPSTPSEPWPPTSSFPKPYPSSHIDAGAEYIDPTPETAPSNIRVDTSSADGMGIKDAFESSMDKTFQKFADRLSQNLEQILRYEYSGQPLLYSKSDAVGQRFSTESQIGGGKGIPRCGNCGAGRKFELQLTPQLIMELEREELGLDGMDWGSVVMGCCERDCCPDDDHDGTGGGVGFVEEWVGVQWEGKATHKRPS